MPLNAVVARVVGGGAGHHGAAAVGAQHQVDHHAADAAVSGSAVDLAVAVTVQEHGAGDGRDGQFTKVVVGGQHAGAQGHGGGAVVGGRAAGAAHAVQAVVVDTAAGGYGAFGHRVAKRPGLQQVVKAVVAGGVGGGAQAHGLVVDVAAGQRDGHAGDAGFSRVAHTVVGVGRRGRRMVGIHRAHQRGDAFAKVVARRTRGRQVADGDAVGGPGGGRVAWGFNTGAITRRLAFAHQVAATGGDVGKAVVAVEVGGGALQFGAGAAVGAAHQAQQHAAQPGVGGGAVQRVVAVAVHVHRAADAGVGQLTKQVARGQLARSQVDGRHGVSAPTVPPAVPALSLPSR
jgi:hypothetical protein